GCGPRQIPAKRRHPRTTLHLPAHQISGDDIGQLTCIGTLGRNSADRPATQPPGNVQSRFNSARCRSLLIDLDELPTSGTEPDSGNKRGGGDAHLKRTGSDHEFADSAATGFDLLWSVIEVPVDVQPGMTIGRLVYQLLDQRCTGVVGGLSIT